VSGLSPVEIVVFGRGVGEAVLVRLADDYWVAIDSFKARGTPVALTYLRARGLDPGHVRAVLATHWHHDHFKGIAEILAAAPQARFYMPAARKLDEFWVLAALGKRSKLLSQPSAGIGLYEVLRVLGDERSPEHTSVNHPIAEVNGQRLFALSPTNPAVDVAMRALALANRKETTGGVWAPPTANEGSVATFLKGDACAVLGADLVKHPQYGWRRAVKESIEQRANRKATFLKVPHHGSHTSDDDALWKELLAPSVLACVTSFSRAKLPRQRDLRRIRDDRGASALHVVTSSEQIAEIATLALGVDPRIRASRRGDVAVARFVAQNDGWRAPERCFLSEVR
jgi:hypothetical protein